MERLPSPRLVTDGMSGSGRLTERYSMTAPGSPAVDSQPVVIAPLLDLADVDAPAATLNVNWPPGRIVGQQDTPIVMTGGWQQPGYIDEGARDQAGFKQT